MSGPQVAGAVEVHFVIRADGTFAGAVGESSNGDAIQLVAVAAVLGRRFTPGLKNGAHVAARMAQMIAVE